MLELYLKLYEARSVNFEARGNAHGIGRDEILGSAAMATSRHPLGHRMVMAEAGDQHAIKALDEWAKSIVGNLSQDVVAVALGRPLPEQLVTLAKASPRYDRERRRSAEIKAKAKHLRNLGKSHDAKEKDLLADGIIHAAIERCKKEILTSGRCPKCRGTGVMERKGDQCPVCNGTGKTIPDVSSIQEKHGDEIYRKFIHLVDLMQIDKSEWIRAFVEQVNAEKVA